MRDRQGVDPELVIREGEPVNEILSQIREDEEIGVLVNIQREEIFDMMHRI